MLVGILHYEIKKNKNNAHQTSILSRVFMMLRRTKYAGFPQPGQRKYGSDLMSCRMQHADISPFTGNQTVNSTVQVRDVAKCNVTHHL